MQGRLLFVLGLVALGVACRQPAPAAEPAAAPTAPVGTKPKLAPEPSPTTSAELKTRLNEARGKVVLVNVWATWCIPCRQEMPDLVALRKELGGRGFELVLVSADFDSAVEESRVFLGEVGVDFPTWRKKEPDQAFIDGLDAEWSGALPFSVLIDRTGAKAATWEGKQDRSQLVARVGPLLDAPPDMRPPAKGLP